MTILRTRQAEGDAPMDVQYDNPLPVKVMQDTQDQGVRVNTGIAEQVAVSTSAATLIVPVNPHRRSVMLTNLTGTQLCYLGPDNRVTAGLARAILTASVGSTVTIFGKGAIWGLSATSAQTVLVWEEELTDGNI